jgi:hypothetical protein
LVMEEHPMRCFLCLELLNFIEARLNPNEFANAHEFYNSLQWDSPSSNWSEIVLLYQQAVSLLEEFQSEADAAAHNLEAKLNELSMRHQFSCQELEDEFSHRVETEKRVALTRFSHISVSNSAQFFVCQRCNAAQCLVCSVNLQSKNECSAHACQQLDEVELLYQVILDVLAISASRSCPHCGFFGVKDLQCTHVKCPQCKQKWCYHCGRKESEWNLGGGTHNEWSPIGQVSGTWCPMYLKQLYVDPNANHDDYSAAFNALTIFHRGLQEKALRMVERITDSNLWKKVVDSKFPQGII